MTEAEHMEARLSAPIDPFIVFANARRLAKRKRDKNWVFAGDLFGLGSTYAYAMCRRLGLDPEGTTATRALPLPPEAS